MKSPTKKLTAGARSHVPVRVRAHPRGRAATANGIRPRFQIKSILVPIDFSAPSKKALAYAVPLAEQRAGLVVQLTRWVGMSAGGLETLDGRLRGGRKDPARRGDEIAQIAEPGLHAADLCDRRHSAQLQRKRKPTTGSLDH